MLKKIPGNVQQDSEECSRGFQECSKRFGGMFEEIPGNAEEDSEEYILKYNKKCAQRFIKTSHVYEHV